MIIKSRSRLHHSFMLLSKSLNVVWCESRTCHYSTVWLSYWKYIKFRDDVDHQRVIDSRHDRMKESKLKFYHSQWNKWEFSFLSCFSLWSLKFAVISTARKRFWLWDIYDVQCKLSHLKSRYIKEADKWCSTLISLSWVSSWFRMSRKKWMIDSRYDFIIK